MLGYYDYSMWLTYASLISAVTGLAVSVSGQGHPYWGMLCLLLCGLCDSFDGRVARRKADRTEQEKNFGIQVDSLSDLVAFGVLPVGIGVGLYRRLGVSFSLQGTGAAGQELPLAAVIVAGALYVLAGLIRLAYFNVTEQELQASGDKKREYYSGLPITMASLFVPTFLMAVYLFNSPLAAVIGYPLLLAVLAAAFVCGRLRVRKAGLGGILIMVGIGTVEAVLYVLMRVTRG